MFCLAVALQCAAFYYFVMKFITYKLEEEPDSAAKYYGLAALFTFFDLMSIWSLLSTYLSNPGYVSDYFKSV